MRLLTILLALLTVPAALAAVDADYLAVVSADAPAQDVVFAANFASALKQLEDVEFSGVTDEELDGVAIEDLSSQSVVLLNPSEDYAIYIVGSTTSSRHERVAQAAVEYLEDEGLEVALFHSDEPYEGTALREYFPRGYILQDDDLRITELTERSVADDESEDDTDEERTDVNEEQPVITRNQTTASDNRSITRVNTTLPSNRTQELPEPAAPQMDARVERVQAEPQGAFSAFWSWLRGVFN